MTGDPENGEEAGGSATVLGETGIRFGGEEEELPASLENCGIFVVVYLFICLF